ncbi:MAG: amidase [Gemmatimonadetes bacterium]|nr:amidase [Gemmatimonadota bacterium]
MFQPIIHLSSRVWPAALGALGGLVFSVLLTGQDVRPAPVAIHEATIPELQEAMARGRLTSVDLVDAYLARIAAYDQRGPELNALVRINPRARSEAAALDAERRSGSRGPLHGIPIILKDNFDTADLPTTGGSLALAGLLPPDDGFVVRKLRDAGAVILGKANMHELAAGITTISSLGGQTRNPYDPRRCPGGSSGGTGAAIAASFAAVGWGSDTCGSIRIPSSVNSLFGLRPTQGLVSRDGVIPLSHTQDIAGPMARTVTDLAIALDATVGPDPADSTTRVLQGRAFPRFVDSLTGTALRGARLGILTNSFRDADEEVADTVRAAARAMKALGAEVVDVTVPDFDSLLSGAGVINFETKFDLIDYLAGTPRAPVASLAEILARGLHHGALETRFQRADTVQARDSEPYRKALAKRAVVRDRIVAILDSLRLDALVYPTLRRKPVLIGDAQLGSNCQLSAVTGLPALSAPAGFTADGLPVGLELLGRPFADVRLVALAYAFEQSGPRRRPPPTTPPLVNGRTPQPVAFTVTAAASPGVARVSFVFDPLRNELSYDVRISGTAADRIHALVIRRSEGDRPGRVVWRLAGPGVTGAAGKATLTGKDRNALVAGRLVLSLFTADRAAPAAESRLVPPAGGS